MIENRTISINRFYIKQIQSSSTLLVQMSARIIHLNSVLTSLMMLLHQLQIVCGLLNKSNHEITNSIDGQFKNARHELVWNMVMTSGSMLRPQLKWSDCEMAGLLQFESTYVIKIRLLHFCPHVWIQKCKQRDI